MRVSRRMFNIGKYSPTCRFPRNRRIIQQTHRSHEFSITADESRFHVRLIKDFVTTLVARLRMESFFPFYLRVADVRVVYREISFDNFFYLSPT